MYIYFINNILIIQFILRFLQPLRSLYTVAAGTRVLLECVGVGEPQPRVQWSKDGEIIGQSDSKCNNIISIKEYYNNKNIKINL